MKAVIPVAGYATRLHPLTKDTAKALLDVGGKEILAHFLDKLDGLGAIDQVVLVSNHKFYEPFRVWVSQRSYNFDITVINDGTTSNEDRIGAVGDFVLGLNEIGSDDHVLISAGDGIFEDSFAEMFDLFHEKGASVIATKESTEEVCRRCGVAGINENRQVTSFVEKPEVPPSNLVGIMTYIIHKDHIQHLHDGYQAWVAEGEMNSGEAIRHMVESGLEVFAYPIKGAWFDIGTTSHLEEARAHFEDNTK